MRDTVALVCGYGCDGHRLTDYARHIHVNLAFTRFKYAVLSGGETNKKSMPGKTEAAVMKGLLLNHRSLFEVEGFFPELVLEETARSTRENIKRFWDILTDRGDLGADIVIFCDRAHTLKVRLLARFILGRWVRVRSYPVIPGRREYLKQLVGTAVSVAGLFSSRVARWELKRRLRVIEQS